MKIQLFITLSLMTLSSIVNAQDAGHLYGMAFGDADFQESDFLAMKPQKGDIEVLSIAKGLGLFSVGASGIDEWRKEYLIFGQTSGYEKSGFLFDQKSGQLIREIKTERPPVDLQFDARLRKFYGLRYAPDRKGVEVVQVSGEEVFTIWKLDDIKFLSIGNSAFDANRGLYIFIARDSKNKTRLYRVNIDNGNILDQPEIDDYLYNELQYDLQDNRLYGLARKKKNISQYFFVEINMLNAYPTIIRPLIDVQGAELGTSGVNQDKGAYFFIAKSKEKQSILYQIDVFDGMIYSRDTLSETLSELHFDNSIFIAKFYKDVVYEYQDFNKESSKFYTKNGDSFLIFEESYINEKIELKDLNYIKDETITAVVLDIYGQKMLEKKIFLADDTIENEVLVEGLPKGIYLIRLKTSDKTYSQRFLKQ